MVQQKLEVTEAQPKIAKDKVIVLQEAVTKMSRILVEGGVWSKMKVIKRQADTEVWLCSKHLTNYGVNDVW